MAQTTEIKGFFVEYYFLSNFHASPIIIGNKSYETVEHWYQASKAKNEQDHEWVRTATTAGISKKRGRRIDIREDWEEIKERIMMVGLRAKFTQNHDLEMALLATGNAYLEETNYWGDTYWGVSSGKGKNRLGVLLMQMREDLRMEQFYV